MLSFPFTIITILSLLIHLKLLGDVQYIFKKDNSPPAGSQSQTERYNRKGGRVKSEGKNQIEVYDHMQFPSLKVQ